MSRRSRAKDLSGLTLSAGDFPARTCHLPEQEKESMPSGQDCGGNTQGSFAYYDQDTLWWRMYQACLPLPNQKGKPPLDGFSESWPASGTMRNGKVYQRRPLVPRNYDFGYLLSPTLRASETDQGDCQSSQGKDVLTLKGLVKVLDGAPVSERTKKATTPTMSAQDAKNCTFPPSQRGRDSIIGYMMSTPTLTAASAGKGSRKTATKKDNGGHQVNLVDVTAHLSGKGGGTLNPRWAEWYMGFPDGWCEVPLED